jgi:hypothetical protein
MTKAGTPPHMPKRMNQGISKEKKNFIFSPKRKKFIEPGKR